MNNGKDRFDNNLLEFNLIKLKCVHFNYTSELISSCHKVCVHLKTCNGIRANRIILEQVIIVKSLSIT